MNNIPTVTRPLYDYSDPRVKQAGYAALIYGGISLASALLMLLKARLEAIPTSAMVLIVSGVIMAGISGGLAFGIFRRSKAATILMVIVVAVPQLYTWFIAHSVTGSLVSIVVAAFVLRGAKAIWEPPDEDDKLSATSLRPTDQIETKGSRIR